MAELKVTQQVMLSCATTMRSGAARLDELRDSVANVRASDVLDYLPSNCKNRLAKVTSRMDDYVSVMTDMGGVLDSAASRYGSAEETIQANHLAGFLSGIQAENTGTMPPVSATDISGAAMVVSTSVASSGNDFLDDVESFVSSDKWGFVEKGLSGSGLSGLEVLGVTQTVKTVVRYIKDSENGTETVAGELLSREGFYRDRFADNWKAGNHAEAIGDVGMAFVCDLCGGTVILGEVATEMAASILNTTTAGAAATADQIVNVLSGISGCEELGTALSTATESIVTGLGEVSGWLSGLIS